ncbi:uncharacterized protein SPPG_02614 [Spizellomyces punctatus DAOM BR117]|uniref:Uncharacterized protein n=1 Tax=Spizellomyces punctatus (strain DAOM BR117) TaxID=645134 RepID=A0A0L0HMU8_SPIPD|nr:uncharacterized protein SPPG_02614 [Spizellomyces punctatus DAOM BR117]KND02119.1 hypothetical protein SPPG_02614 [Spizellomyces punctatus DAOM BR117]|eukprot:XP_016610158.1 hypothetical protein SPPG_02614 [Spizellomyces punctatus DAOM BR117]
MSDSVKSSKSNASFKNSRKYRRQINTNGMRLCRGFFNDTADLPAHQKVFAPSPVVEALVNRLLAPRQVLRAGSRPNLERKAPEYFGDNPVVSDHLSANLFQVVGKADSLEGNHEAEWAPLKTALLSVMNHGEVFAYVSDTHILALPEGIAGLTRPKPDVIVGYCTDDPPVEPENPYTLLADSLLPLRARCGDPDCVPFPFYVQERKSDRAAQFGCVNQLLAGLRAVMHAWELVLERQNIAVVGTTLVGYHLSLYVMGYKKVRGTGMYIAYHVGDYSILNGRDVLCLMSLMVAVREEGLRLFDLLAPIKWQDLQGLDVDGDDMPGPDPEEGGEDDESEDDDRSSKRSSRSGRSARSSKRRHKRARLHGAGGKDPVLDTTAKVQGWLSQVSQPESPGAARGAEDPFGP